MVREVQTALQTAGVWLCARASQPVRDKTPAQHKCDTMWESHSGALIRLADVVQEARQQEIGVRDTLRQHPVVHGEGMSPVKRAKPCQQLPHRLVWAQSSQSRIDMRIRPHVEGNQELPCAFAYTANDPRSLSGHLRNRLRAYHSWVEPTT